MTLAAQTPVDAYVGNGGTNTYPFTFPIFSNTHLLVTVVDPTGNASTLVLTTDYTVTGLNAAGQPPATGSIVLVSGGQAWLTGGNLTTGWTLTIQLNVPLAQTHSYRNGGDTYRFDLENSFDYQMMCLQMLQSGGFVLTDIVTGHTYRLLMVSGVLSQLQLT